MPDEGLEALLLAALKFAGKFFSLARLSIYTRSLRLAVIINFGTNL